MKTTAQVQGCLSQGKKENDNHGEEVRERRAVLKQHIKLQQNLCSRMLGSDFSTGI